MYNIAGGFFGRAWSRPPNGATPCPRTPPHHKTGHPMPAKPTACQRLTSGHAAHRPAYSAHAHRPPMGPFPWSWRPLALYDDNGPPTGRNQRFWPRILKAANSAIDRQVGRPPALVGGLHQPCHSEMPPGGRSAKRVTAGGCRWSAGDCNPPAVNIMHQQEVPGCKSRG